MSVAFLLTTLVIVATPGTGVLYTLSAGLSRGARASVVAAVGCTLGVVPASGGGDHGSRSTSQCERTRLPDPGVPGHRLPPLHGLEDDSGQGHARAGGGAGPSLGVAFLPQFVNPDKPHVFLRMLELSAVFMLLTFAIFVAYGIPAAAVRNHVISRPRVLTWMRRVFAGSFVALAGRLAVAAL